MAIPNRLNVSQLKVILIMSLLFLLINSIVNIDAYGTYELVQHCKKFDSKIHFPEENVNDDILSNGLIVPKHNGHNDKHKNKDNNNNNDNDNENVNDNEYVNQIYDKKSNFNVTVDTGYDTSSIRVVVENDNVFRSHLRCSILVMPMKPNGLIVSVKKFKVRPGTDWLRISIVNSSFTRTFSHIRINSERDSVAYVAHHGVLIEFGTKAFLPKDEKVELELILTSFREADLCDIDREFDCGSFRCISKYYLCDGFNNCGDGRDEINCPMDNITNYLIISTTVLLIAFLIFLCCCYKCFRRRVERHPPNRKQYQYLKIRTSSQSAAPAPYFPSRFRSHSIRSEADLPKTSNLNPGDLRRVKYATVGDSMPVLIPSSSNDPSFANNYGTTGSTVLLPYQPYTITFANNGSARIGLMPMRPSTANRLHQMIPEHHTCPLPQPSYPVLNPQLFTPPPPADPTPPPPPYSLKDPEINKDDKIKK